jgi:DNA processing protein
MQFPIRQLTRSEFPILLKELPDAPKRLFLRGTLPPIDYKMLCVVGSRATSPYGRRMCQALISGLARYPVAIISGMALGIDAEAARIALDVGLPTVAVLPSSLDDKNIYPASNRPLAQRILARGSALISEYEAPYKAQLYSFPARDRIMAGMSVATLIIEAGEKSGTLITARLALDYNREVLAIPHELGKETGMGVNRLIREGATLVRGPEDILEALGLASEPTQFQLPTDLSETETKILTELTEALEKDEIIERAELTAQEVSIALSSLQIRGLINERLGKIERV